MRYEVGLTNKDEQTTRDLIAFFRTVAKGKLNTFRFRDFLPGESHLEHERFALTDGIQTAYPLLRTYQVGTETYVRYITKPTGVVRVWVDNAEMAPDDFTVGETTGIVTPDSLIPPGHALYATCDYDIETRFNTDTLPIKRVDVNIFSWESVPLIEVRAA